MRLIHDEIEILAPPEPVWAMLTDFEAYAVWNPFIRRVIAPIFHVGEILDVFLQPSGQRGMRIRPEILRLSPPHELCWHSYVLHRFILHGEHTFRLRPTATGTLFIQRLRFGGLLAPLIVPLIYSDTLRGMEEMDAAFKVRIERFHQPPTL